MIGLDLSFAYLSEIASERLGLNALRGWENGSARQVSGDLSDLPLFRSIP